MKIKAKVSFCGSLCMAAGQVVDCDDEYIVNDLLCAGYVESVEAEKPQKGVEKNDSKPVKPRRSSKLPKN